MPPSQDTLSAVNRQTVTCVGTFPCIIEYCGRFVEETIYICPEVEDFLLAWYVSQQVNILPDTYPQPINLSKTPRKLASILKAENTRFIISENPTEAEISKIENKLIKSYNDVFSEDTTLREMNSKPMKISLKDDAVLFALPVPRQIPLAFRRMVKIELDQLVQAGVIAPVTEAADWVHPMVVVQKPNGGIRLCIRRRRRRRLKGIHSRPDTNRTGAEGLSFYYPRLLHCLDQMLAVVLLSQHRVSSSKTVRPRAPCGARCMGHIVSTWSAVCSEAPHSRFGEGARPHLCMDEWNRPTPVRRRLSLTQAARGKPIPTGLTLVPGTKARSLEAFSQYSAFHL